PAFLHSSSSPPAPPTPLSSPLSLHDALPISARHLGVCRFRRAGVISLLADYYYSLPRISCHRAAQPCGQRRPHHRGGSMGEAQKDRKSTRLNSSHVKISYAVFCLKKKKSK